MSPRPVDPALRACYERENPSAELHVEVSAPDAECVLRRPNDQLLPPAAPVVSMVPANGLVAAPAGGVQLAPQVTQLVNFPGQAAGPMDVNFEDPTRRIKGLMWQVDASFDRATLRSFTATIARDPMVLGIRLSPWLELQIYRAAAVQGERVDASGKRTPSTRWEFIPLLSTPARAGGPSQVWNSDVAQVAFDLTGAGVVIDPAKEALPSNVSNGLATYYFAIRLGEQVPNGYFHWRSDPSSTAVAGLGTMEWVYWARDSASQDWQQTRFGKPLACALSIETYAPAGGQVQTVYQLDLGKAPSGGTTGRVRVERALPQGTTCTVELSTAGSGGPWTAVADGDAVAIAQQLYHLRLTMKPSATGRATPVLAAAGVEFRTPYDVSLESQVSTLQRDVAMPYCQGTIGDGALAILRTGRRDFLDVATTLGSTQPATRLEADIFLRSRHPRVTRDKWLRLERAAVTERVPTETSERLTLLAQSARLQRQVPLPKETINQALTVQSATATAITVTTDLPGTTAAGTEYDGQHYYARVRTSATLPSGALFEIQGNTGTRQLDFAAGVLSGQLAAGDVVEVHSGVMNTEPLTYKDADPADVWWDLIVNQALFGAERVGLGHLPRGGLPPKVTDICPGDAAAQAKRKVSISIDSPERADELLDQVSFLMGGATIDIGGQLCFVQLYPLYDATGACTVPLPMASQSFDPRDYFNLSLPQGVAKRLSAVLCEYGVDLTVPEAARLKASQTEYADSDAINWLTLNPAEARGRGAIPDEIARWCYNSADAGFWMASEAARRVVTYFATGLRIWEWGTRDAYPDLHPGDVVTIVTDRYTDYDVGSQQPISGWQAYTLVLLGVSGDGRRFRAALPGLNRSTVRAVGGQQGETSEPPPTPPGQPALPPIGSLVTKTETSTQETLTLTGTLGAGGTGPLQYQKREDKPGAPGAWSAAAALGASVDLTVQKDARFEKRLVCRVIDADGLTSPEVSATIEPRFDFLDRVIAKVMPTGINTADLATIQPQLTASGNNATNDGAVLQRSPLQSSPSGSSLGSGKRAELKDGSVLMRWLKAGVDGMKAVIGDYTVSKAVPTPTTAAFAGSSATNDNAGELQTWKGTNANSVSANTGTGASSVAYDHNYRIRGKLTTAITNDGSGGGGQSSLRAVQTRLQLQYSLNGGGAWQDYGSPIATDSRPKSSGVGSQTITVDQTVTLSLESTVSGVQFRVYPQVYVDDPDAFGHPGAGSATADFSTAPQNRVEWSYPNGTAVPRRGWFFGKESGEPHGSIEPLAAGEIPADANVVEGEWWYDGVRHGPTIYDGSAPGGLRLDGWELLARGVLGAAAASLDLANLPARDELMIVVRCPGTSAAARLALQFNGDGAANYNWRHLTCVTGGAALVNQVPAGAVAQAVLEGIAVTLPRQITAVVMNHQGTVKGMTVQTHTPTAAAATLPTLHVAGGAQWVNTAVQITRVTLLLDAAGNLNAGTGLLVFGRNFA